jgi:hypothetical protein
MGAPLSLPPLSLSPLSLSPAELRQGSFEMPALMRFLQHVGLALPPIAVLLQVMEAIDVRGLLMLGGFGFCLFWVSRILEGYVQ